MLGYKASYNQVCRNQRYEVGQTYTINGKLIMCQKGFHFCEKPDDVFEYYPAYKDLVLFEVESLGEIITQGNKSVTNKIKINRIIPISEWNNIFNNHKFDDKGNLIHYKNSYGFEAWNEYDENSNLLHYKDSNGDEYWHKYDKNNNCIHEKYLDGYERYLKYDQNNNLIDIKMKYN